MTFHNIQFPTDISYGSSGGPAFSTDITTLSNGFEQRTSNWQYPLCRYNVAYGVRSDAQLSALIAFFRARMGRTYGFLFKDWADFSSAPSDQAIAATDQLLGAGDGTTTSFQLIKHYTSGTQTTSRLIHKPVISTLVVAIDGTSTTDFIVSDTGLITFTAPPASGTAITAGFEFDVPVRFDTDQLSTSLDSYGVGSASDVTCVEVRL